jgi:hypothetical protein
MFEAPDFGATLIGTGTLRKDQATIFEVPLPPSLAGERLGRSMWVTIAWFSPVMATRARYRLARMEAIPHDHDLLGDLIEDDGWCLNLTGCELDKNLIKRGTVWSRRLVHRSLAAPDFDDEKVLPVQVQCRDSSGGGLSPDDDIEFAIAVTLEVEDTAAFDVHNEIQNRLRVGLRN